KKGANKVQIKLVFPNGLKNKTAFFFDFVGGMVDFERVHVYNSIHRRIGCRYGKSPTEAGLVQGVGK
ncbi:hypothetical protein ICR73_001188, partial [Neisseria gonorrhoeae]